MGKIITNPNIVNASYLTKDLVQGDESVAQREEFSLLTGKEIKQSFNLLLADKNLSDKEKAYLLANMWRIHYRVKPPTMKEFLTSDWIGPTAEHVYPHVDKILTEYWEPDSAYRNLILAGGIGIGKSFTATLWALFVTVNLWAMRDPKKFFDLSKATSIVQALISFTMDKAEQLLVQPFMQILLSSPRFRRVKMEERLNFKQEEYPDEICFTTAGRMGVFQFYNDVHYIVTSSPSGILGLNMITATLSEISFFIDKGFSVEYINRIYQDSKKRVHSRFGYKYLAGTVIDSSPNDIELSPIDKYIFEGEAYKDKRNYIVTGPQWEFLPKNYPIWQETGDTFPVFRGNSGKPPELLTDETINKYPEDQVYNVPIDVKGLFEDDLLKAVKDICGWPSGSSGLLLRDESVIENVFSYQLRNIYTSITAPSSKSSSRLIWDTIKDDFFIPYKGGYEFYRNPTELRYIHVDLAETKDMASISMVHPEITKGGEIIYVTDFTIALSPEKERINLYAVLLFIKDLRDLGKLKIDLVTFDQYQSSTIQQFLRENGFNCEKLSVDIDIKIYLTYISLIQSGRVKAGKNIFMKNNLKSLQEIRQTSGKKKVEHTKGKIVYNDGANWKLSQMGKFAKDVTDSNSGAVWNALQHFKGAPRYFWKDDSESSTGSVEEDKKILVQEIKQNLINEMAERYGFAVEGNL